MPRLKNDVRETDRLDVLSAAKCRYCGDLIGPFEVDHLVPLSRGGTNARSNLVCSCISCNTQKGYHLLHEWMQWRDANGMSWPPIAQHATDPQHYQDHCSGCRDETNMGEGGQTWIYSPHRMDFLGSGYRCSYRCPHGHRPWTCYYGLGTSYYTDCACAFCVAYLLEEAA